MEGLEGQFFYMDSHGFNIWGALFVESFEMRVNGLMADVGIFSLRHVFKWNGSIAGMKKSWKNEYNWV